MSLGPAWLLRRALEGAVRSMSSLVVCRVDKSTPGSAGVGFGFVSALGLLEMLVWSSVGVPPSLEVGLE